MLIDFGVSVDIIDQKDDQIDENMGSKMFWAPEMFMQNIKIHGELTDIWALGITFYFLICGSYPWKDAKTSFQLKEHVLLKEIDFSIIRNETVRNLFQKILTKDPLKRLRIESILNDPWVTNNGKDIIDAKQVLHYDNGHIGNVDRLISMNTMGRNSWPNSRRNSEEITPTESEKG